MRNRLQSGLLRELLGLFVCVCLVAQPLVVPLHLALADHVSHAVGGELHAAVPTEHPHGHRHSHGHDHLHRHSPVEHEAPGTGDRDGGAPHRPHPAQDHFDQAPEKLTPPSLDFGPLAIPRESSTGPPDTVDAKPLESGKPRTPELPPPRSPARPRAPPSIA